MTRLGVRAAFVDGRWVEGDVEVVEGRIEAVGSAAPGGALVAVPGFVDRQVNGFAGIDLRAASPDDYAVAASALAAHGATAVLPTFYSSTEDGYRAALGALREVHRRPPAGTRLLGAHLEGPFLSRSWAGAHDPVRLVPVDLALAGRLLDAGPIALMTIAPELDAALELVDLLVGRGVMVSMGHTDATAPQAHHGIDRGVSMITHCHNAHRRFAPRDPGPAGAAIARPEVAVGLICDGVHLADETILGVMAAAGPRVVVVTDAVAPAGSSLTSWDIDGVQLEVADGKVVDVHGRLAGSAITPDASLRHLLTIGVAAEVAIPAMSTNPARGLGLGTHDLVPGTVADVTVLDDRWEVVRTLVGGHVVADQRS